MTTRTECLRRALANNDSPLITALIEASEALGGCECWRRLDIGATCRSKDPNKCFRCQALARIDVALKEVEGKG
jgi:hypothetical protein